MLTARILIVLFVLFGASGGFFLWALRSPDRRLLGRKPLVLMLGLIALGFLLPNAPAMLAVLVLLLPLVARSRPEAATLFAVAFLVLPDLGYGIKLGSLYLFSFDAEEALAISLALALMILPDRREPDARGRRQHAPFVLFFAALLWTQLAGRTTGDMGRQLIMLTLSYLVPYVCLSRAIGGAVDFRRFILAFALAGFCLSAEAVYEARNHWPLLAQMEGHLGVPSRSYFSLIYKVRGGLMRSSASFAESTSLATFFVWGLLAVVALRASFRSRPLRYVVLAGFGAGLFVTGSRGGWAAALLALLLFDVYGRRYAALWSKLVVIGAAGLLLLFAAQSSPTLRDRLGLSASGLETADYRQQLLTRGLQEFRKSPLIGRSQPALIVAMADLKQGEGLVDFVNTWLFFLLTLGTIGTAVITTALVWPVALTASLRRLIARQPALAATGGFLFAATFAFLGVLFVTSWQERPGIIWTMMLALTAALAPLVRREARRPPAQTAAAAERPAETAPLPAL